jgi:AraC-like DNA-binding protein
MNNETSNATQGDNSNSSGLEFQLICAKGDDLQIILNAPMENLPFRLPEFKVDLVKGKFGEMYFYNFKGKGFEIWISLYLIKEATTIIGKADRSILEWHNTFQNGFKSTWSGIFLPDPKEDQFNLSYVPHIENKAEFEGGMSYMTFDFHFTPEFLQAFSKHYAELDIFLNAIDQKKSLARSISRERLFLTPGMRREIESILNYNSHPAFAVEFYRANAIELLILMLDKITEYKCGFSPKQIRAAVEARDIIDKNFKDTLSTPKLAKIVDLDECTLKRCFKYLFKITIYQYAKQKKIEHAQKLLLDPELSSLDITLAIGYAETSHLSAAFKDVTGKTPKEWREMHNVKPKRKRKKKK